MRSLSFLALLALPSVPAAQSVWVVSATEPGADFASIQPAVDAAGSGDTILVRPGTYTGFQIDGKALSVVGDDVLATTVDGPTFGATVRVENLAPDQTVVLRGFSILGASAVGGFAGIELDDNAGTVWLEGLALDMFGLLTINVGKNHAIQATNSACLFVVDCTVIADGATHALALLSSSSWIYGGSFAGGDGDSSSSIPATYFDGGDGLRIVAGEAFVSGGTFRGGDGLGAIVFSCNGPTDGGNGSTVAAGLLLDLDSVFAGGVGGDGTICSEPPGADGVDVEVSGTRTTLPGSARSLSVGSPVYEGETLTQTFVGQPFELALHAVGFATLPGAFVPELSGPAFLTGPQFVRLRGVLDAGGELVKSFPLADLGVDGVTAWIQPIFVDGSLDLHLGAPSAVTLLDAAYAP